MNRTLRNLPFVTKRIETIDFKTFCEGGSPEYVAAKQKLKNLHLNNADRTACSSAVRPSFTAYSLFINPLILIDVKFLIAVGCVILVAVLEKKLAENGIIAPAALIAGIIKIGFPVAAFVSILVLISKLGVFL
jgi:hypothetical protein